MAKHLNPLEKEFLIHKYRSNQTIRLSDFCSANSVSNSAFRKWLSLYDKGGLEGLSRADAELGEVLPAGIDRTEEAYKREILRLRIENERLKKKLYGTDERGWANGVCSFKDEEFRIVDMLSRDFAIADICALMGVSRAGYYKWKHRKPSTRDINRESLVEAVKKVHDKHSTHGYRWVAAFMRNNFKMSVSDNLVYKCPLSWHPVRDAS